MSELNDSEYYAARAVKATGLAEAASDPAIAAIHREMAEGYIKLTQHASGDKPKRRISTK